MNNTITIKKEYILSCTKLGELLSITEEIMTKIYKMCDDIENIHRLSVYNVDNLVQLSEHHLFRDINEFITEVNTYELYSCEATYISRNLVVSILELYESIYSEMNSFYHLIINSKYTDISSASRSLLILILCFDKLHHNDTLKFIKNNNTYIHDQIFSLINIIIEAETIELNENIDIDANVTDLPKYIYPESRDRLTKVLFIWASINNN
jgi:hypothetical protein